MQRYQNFIGGEWVDPASGAWFELTEPFSGRAWAEIPRSNADDAVRAVAAAHAAFELPEWSGLTVTARGGLLRKLAQLIEANVDLLGTIEQRDNGKLMAEVSGQVKNVAQWFDYYAGLADKIEGAVVPINKADVFNYVKWEPLGVVVAITPMEFPAGADDVENGPGARGRQHDRHQAQRIHLGWHLELARLADQAGFPKGVVNVVTGYGAEVGAPLVTHPLTAKIAFTGGDAGGQAVNEAAAPGLKKVTLELGGKSPNIILDDADLEQAVKGAISGVFGASGQTCMAGSRLLVQRSIHDDFVAQLVEATKAAKVGDPSQMDTQVGPVATRAQFEKILRMIEMGKAEGATVACGGHALTGEGYGQGQFIAPTIFTGVSNTMRIAREEVFGPVVCAIPFDTVDEALAIANDTEFGLAAGSGPAICTARFTA